MRLPEEEVPSWKETYPELVRAFGEVLRVEDFETTIVQKHLQDLAVLPLEIHARLLEAGLKEVHFANRSVPELDQLQRLRGVNVIPNLARTWDEVPGAYTQGVLVAGAGKHGSHSVLFHEWGHAVGDLLKHNQDGDLIVAFLRLRSELDPFLARLEPMKGARELFAEGIASYFGAGKQEAINEFDAEFVQYIERVIQKEQAHG